MLAVFFLTGGFVLLYFGAEALVRGSGSLALRIGISPLVVGITIVALGTSSPELIVSIGAAITERPDIALGNVIGSNICNIALILGLSSLIKPLGVHIQLIRIDVPIMVGCCLILLVFLLDHELGRIEGGALFGGLLIYLYYTFREARRGQRKLIEETSDIPPVHVMRSARSIVFLVGGLIGLAAGANLFVRGAVLIAEWFEISQAVVGLTIVALGTSLPELATSLVAAFKGEGDISIGNVVGSNIFNILAILGLTALVHPLSSTDIGIVDLGVMTVVAFMMLPVVRTGHRISRWEGAALLAVYVSYTVYLVTDVMR